MRRRSSPVFRRNQRSDSAGFWARRRCRVDRGTPRRRAASRAGKRATCARRSGSTRRRGRPSRPPCVLARARPALTRSTIRSLSKAAIAARTAIWSLPAAVVASIPSFNETKPTPSVCSSSSSVIRCFRFRPSRSRRQQTSTSNRRRRASATSWSRASRRSFAPLTPRSTYSVGVRGFGENDHRRYRNGRTKKRVRHRRPGRHGEHDGRLRGQPCRPGRHSDATFRTRRCRSRESPAAHQAAGKSVQSQNPVRRSFSPAQAPR